MADAPGVEIQIEKKTGFLNTILMFLGIAETDVRRLRRACQEQLEANARARDAWSRYTNAERIQLDAVQTMGQARLDSGYSGRTTHRNLVQGAVDEYNAAREAYREALATLEATKAYQIAAGRLVAEEDPALAARILKEEFARWKGESRDGVGWWSSEEGE